VALQEINNPNKQPCITNPTSIPFLSSISLLSQPLSHGAEKEQRRKEKEKKP